MQHLSEDERAKVAALVDHVIAVASARYGVTPNEIAEVVAHYRETKVFYDRLKSGAWMSLIGFIVGAMLIAFWEGFKSAVHRVIP